VWTRASGVHSSLGPAPAPVRAARRCGRGDRLRHAARARSGLLLPTEVSTLTAGERRGLALVQPRVWLAATQPVDLVTAVAAVEHSARDVVLLGRTALWAHGIGDGGVAERGVVVEVGVRDDRQLVLLPPATVRRLAPALLRGARTVCGHRTVALETALVQTAEQLDDTALLRLVEEALRQRRTTVERLHRRCGRGIAGSARLRRVLAVLDDGAVDRQPRLLRRALERRGVTGLESEVLVPSSLGEVAYLDLVHRASRNAFEVDGWTTHSTRERFLGDRRRDRWVMRDHGLRTTRLAAAEVEQDLDGIVAELLPMVRAA
jgi:hypothetical protein